MHELLKKYISEKEAQKQQFVENEKNELLMSEGLYEKVYLKDESSDGYLNWDSEKKQYYKKVPIQISDSEYEELKKYCKPPKANNTIATVLKVTAWCVFIVGLILGFILGAEGAESSYFSNSDFSLLTAFTYWSFSFITFIFTLALAEIINLLNDIKNK